MYSQNKMILTFTKIAKELTNYPESVGESEWSEKIEKVKKWSAFEGAAQTFRKVIMPMLYTSRLTKTELVTETEWSDGLQRQLTV